MTLDEKNQAVGFWCCRCCAHMSQEDDLCSQEFCNMCLEVAAYLGGIRASDLWENYSPT